VLKDVLLGASGATVEADIGYYSKAALLETAQTCPLTEVLTPESRRLGRSTGKNRWRWTRFMSINSALTSRPAV
jgi:hypothetical protein